MSDVNFGIITPDLCEPVAELLEICFPNMPIEDQYTAEELCAQAAVFAEGTIVARAGKRVVGMGTGIFIDINFNDLPPTEFDLLYTDGQSNHRDNGAYYYGSDLAVHPDFRGRGLAREIYDLRKKLVIDRGKHGFAAASVLQGYVNFKAEFDPATYIAKVVAGEIFDPTLSVQLRNGFEVIRPLKDFFQHPPSDSWSALIVWPNPELNRHE